MKQTFFISLVILVIILICILSYFPVKKYWANQECMRLANKSPEHSAQRTYYLCLQERNLNPYKYTWKGKKMSDNVMKLVEINTSFQEHTMYPDIPHQLYSAPNHEFTFEYPEFKGWETQSISEDGYTIFLHHPELTQSADTDLVPSIKITSYDPLVAPPPGLKEYNAETGQIDIATPLGSLIIITLPKSEEVDFSAEYMAYTIIDTIHFDDQGR